jgi:hypothetical protein
MYGCENGPLTLRDEYRFRGVRKQRAKENI